MLDRLRLRIQKGNAMEKVSQVAAVTALKPRRCDDEVCNKVLERYRVRFWPYEFCSARCYHHWYRIDKTFRDLVDKYKNGSNSEPCQ